jgi:hypothetical protein
MFEVDKVNIEKLKQFKHIYLNQLKNSNHKLEILERNDAIISDFINAYSDYKEYFEK